MEFLNRRKAIQARLLSIQPTGSRWLVYLTGEQIANRTGTDVELDFRQESFFLYCTGVNEHDAGLLLNVSSGEWALVLRRVSLDDQVWIGASPSADELKKKYMLEHVIYEDELDSYLPIVAYGTNAAILHYNHNNADLPEAPTGLLLVDAGGEYNGYASDITRTFPVNGVFSDTQKNLYNVVLDCQKAIISLLRPGLEWEDLHRQATEMIAQGLVNIGIIKLSGESLKDVCWKHHIPQLFFPHGLGHLIGMDVHDVGGYPEGVQRIQEPGIRYLRMRRKLLKGMVVTVEPGCYFIEQLLDPALKDKQKSRFLDAEVLKQYRGEGGVRIEDCVLITDAGHENLTTAVKDIDAIERLIRA